MSSTDYFFVLLSNRAVVFRESGHGFIGIHLKGRVVLRTYVDISC